MPLKKSQLLADYISEKRKTNLRKLKDMVKKGQLKILIYKRVKSRNLKTNLTDME